MLKIAEDFTPIHVNPVPVVPRVPSRREAQAAFSRLVAKLREADIEVPEGDLEVLTNYMVTRG